MKTQQQIIELQLRLAQTSDARERFQIQQTIEQLNALRRHQLPTTFEINNELSFDEHLKEFQRRGVSWLYHKCYNNSSCLLADEPGLGKTVYVLQLIQNVQRFPVIIVAPPTLCSQWIQMAYIWTHGIKFKMLSSVPCELTDVNIVSYDFVVLHSYAFEFVPFAVLIADEVHYLKNQNTQRYTNLLKLKAEFRLGLSGTPIQNSYEELYSILFFLRIGTLPGRQYFYDTYVTPIKSARGSLNIEAVKRSSLAARQLQRLVAPIILRRRKSEVGMELPEKKEYVILFKMSASQEREYTTLLSVRSRTSKATAFGVIVQLQQICDHPQLREEYIVPSNSAKVVWIVQKLGQILSFDARALLDYPIRLSYKLSDEDAPQLAEIDSDLSFEQSEDTEPSETSEFNISVDKIIIFSQSLRFLAILQEILAKLGIQTLTMTGKTSQAQRRETIRRFNTESVQILLTSPRVGGIGLNLTAANNVIISSPSWNPAVDTQASYRTWRFGYRRPVRIWRFAAAGTIEERALEKQGIKYILSDRVLENAFESVKIRYGSVFQYVSPRRELTIRGYEEEQQMAIYEATKRKTASVRNEVDYDRLAGQYLDKYPFVSDSFFPPPIDQILGKMMQVVDKALKSEQKITKKELDEQLQQYSEYEREIAHCYAIVFSIADDGALGFQPHVMNI